MPAPVSLTHSTTVPSMPRLPLTSMLPPVMLGSMPCLTAFSTSVSSAIAGKRMVASSGRLATSKCSRSGIRKCISSK
jgi:hypothetical protein